MGITKDPGAALFFVLFPHTLAPAAETTSSTRSDLPHQTHCLLARPSAPKPALQLLSTSVASVLMVGQWDTYDFCHYCDKQQ